MVGTASLQARHRVALCCRPASEGGSTQCSTDSPPGKQVLLIPPPPRGEGQRGGRDSPQSDPLFKHRSHRRHPRKSGMFTLLPRIRQQDSTPNSNARQRDRFTITAPPPPDFILPLKGTLIKGQLERAALCRASRASWLSRQKGTQEIQQGGQGTFSQPATH